MNQATSRSGGCLCGAIRFTARPEKAEMGVCHCGKCRRWSGGTFMAVDCGTSLEIEDESQLGVYVSSDWGERVFCKSCGSTLFWRMRDGSNTVISAQAFDEPGDFLFASEIFTDEQPPNYAFANQTRRLTGPEFVALVTGESELQNG